MKHSLTLIAIVFSIALSTNLGYAQNIYGLEKVIQLGQENSNRSRIAMSERALVHQEISLDKKRILPNIALSGVLPAFSNSTTRIISPAGEEIFVTQNQVFNDFGLNIVQNEPFLNGTFEVSFYLSRINLLGDSQDVSYFSNPFRINYSLSSFFHNEYKWNNQIKKSEELVSELAFDEQQDQISLEIVEFFFSIVKSKKKLENINKNIVDIKRINKNIERRISLGTSSKQDLMTLSLEMLELENKAVQVSSQILFTKKELCSLIKSEETSFNIDTSLNLLKPTNDLLSDFHFLENESNLEFFRFLGDSLELSKELDKNKRINQIDLDVNLSYGLSGTGNQLIDASSSLLNQHNHSLALKVNIFDFGRRSEKENILRNELDIKRMKYFEIKEEQRLKFEATLNDAIFALESIELMAKAKDIAIDKYNFILTKFPFGEISLRDLIESQQSLLEYENRYVEFLKEFWVAYYTLRKLS